MAVDVLMPQMGESVTEGTVTKWLKKIGDSVGRDEPLFEISTDKVDAEIPAPTSGVLSKILVNEGQTVGVHSVVAQIEVGGAGEQASAQKPAAAAKPSENSKPAATVATSTPTPKIAAGQPGPAEKKAEAAEEIRSSPLVRRLAAENNVDLTQVRGTGLGGRVTKEDLLSYIDLKKEKQAPFEESAGIEGEQIPRVEPQPRAPQIGAREEVVPMTQMRKKIAEHMVLSRRTSAHVTTVFAVDFTRVANLFSREKERFEREENTRLTYMPFFIRAVIDGLKRFPILNSSVSGDNIIY